MIIRSKYLIDAQALNKIQGRPFFVQEEVAAIRGQLGLASANGSKPTPTAAVAELAGSDAGG